MRYRFLTRKKQEGAKNKHAESKEGNRVLAKKLGKSKFFLERHYDPLQAAERSLYSVFAKQSNSKKSEKLDL